MILAIMILPTIVAISREVITPVPTSSARRCSRSARRAGRSSRKAVLPYARSGHRRRDHPRPRPGARRDDGRDDGHRQRRRLPTASFDQSQTIASKIATTFNEASIGLQTSSLIALGLILLVITIILNVIARLLVWRVGRAASGMSDAMAAASTHRLDRARASSGSRARPAARRSSTGVPRPVASAPPILVRRPAVRGHRLRGDQRHPAPSTSTCITKPPKALGIGGGAANAILGTLQMVPLATLIAVPIGVLGGDLRRRVRRAAARRGSIRFAADVMVGIPSILIGIFVFTFLVLPFKQFNAFAGSVALAVIMIPVIMRTTEEILQLVPNTLREASLALGVPSGGPCCPSSSGPASRAS